MYFLVKYYGIGVKLEPFAQRDPILEMFHYSCLLISHPICAGVEAESLWSGTESPNIILKEAKTNSSGHQGVDIPLCFYKLKYVQRPPTCLPLLLLRMLHNPTQKTGTAKATKALHSTHISWILGSQCQGGWPGMTQWSSRKKRNCSFCWCWGALHRKWYNNGSIIKAKQLCCLV